MKYYLIILLAIVTFLLGYQFGGKTETITNTVVKKVSTGFDSTFVSKILSEKDSLDGIVNYLHSVNNNLLAKLSQKKDSAKPRVIVDTLVAHDTAYIAYSSPFKLGVDTLNCSGIVSFDMQRFSFQDVKFQYPQRTITKIQVQKRVDWLYVALAFIGGAVVENQTR